MQMPLILKSVQSLGELHAARYSYTQVFEQQTARRPEEWTRYVPGLGGLVTASTRNRALVSATANVEAGVDLSKASFRQVGGQRQIVLPRVQVYRPQVDAKIHSARPGLFWRDDNIALAAVRATEARVREAAISQGIAREAESNVRKRVATLANGFGAQGIQVVFDAS